MSRGDLGEDSRVRIGDEERGKPVTVLRPLFPSLPFNPPLLVLLVLLLLLVLL